MSCGFGAAVLVFMLIEHNSAVHALDSASGARAVVPQQNERLAALNKEIEGVQNKIAVMRKTLTQAKQEAEVIGEGELAALKKKLKKKEAALLKAREEGAQLTEIKGDGKRQYLTGLEVSGRRILVLFDKSASMLDDELVNILRGRHLPDNQKRKAGKWRWSVAILNWLLAHLPENSRYQVFGFDEQAKPLIPGTGRQWLNANDKKRTGQLRSLIKEWVPEGGTNLQLALRRAKYLSPPPDVIYLITDGLPTLEPGDASDGIVSGEERVGIYRKAVSELMQGVTVNVVLLPTKGDPLAAGLFWELAGLTNGRFLAPPWDWP